MTAAPFIGRTIHGVTPTTTGVQSYESPGFGTPVGGLIMASLGLTLGTLANGMSSTWGVFDSVETMCSFGYDRDAQATQDSHSGGLDNTGVIFRLYDDSGTIVVEAEFDSWSANGVNINWTIVDATNQYQFTIGLVGGTEAEAFVFKANATAAGVTITPGFATDFILTSMLASQDGTLIAEARFGLGIAAPASLNTSAGTYSDNGVSTTETKRVASDVDLGRTVRIASPTPDIFGGETVIHTYDATSFIVQGAQGGVLGVSGGPRICGLAVKAGPTADVHVDVDDPTPTSVTTENKTDPGHESGFLYVLFSGCTSANNIQLQGTSGVGITDFKSGERSMNMISENNVGTSNAASMFSDKLVEMWNHSGSTQLLEATAVEQANGFDLTWTIVGASAFRLKYLSVEEVPQVVSPTGIASGEMFGTPTVTPQAIEIEPSGIASAEVFGTPSLAVGAVAVAPSGIASAEAFGTPSLAAKVTLAPSGIASAEAFGTPSLAAGATTVTPSGIASAEAFGNPALDAFVTISINGIASGEAFGLPTLSPGHPFIVPVGIPSAEAFGNPVLMGAGAQVILPLGISSAEAFGIPALLGGSALILVPSIGSAEAFGYPFLAGGFIPVTLKKKIHDALIARAKAGTFVIATYDGDLNILEQGEQVPPESVLANEVESAYARESRHGRKVRDDRTAWKWELRLRFHQEVITELFEEEFLADPIIVPRELGDPDSRQAIVSLLRARFEHPPQQGASNGTEVVFEVNAQVSPA